MGSISQGPRAEASVPRGGQFYSITRQPPLGTLGERAKSFLGALRRSNSRRLVELDDLVARRPSLVGQHQLHGVTVGYVHNKRAL